MLNSDKTTIYENGYENGYSDGFRLALESIKEKLDECVCAFKYLDSEEYKYIPYKYYEDAIKELFEFY